MQRKRQYCKSWYVGNCLFTGSQRRKNSAGNGLRLVTKPTQLNKRLSHVSQAARFFGEVDMEVDEKISRKAGRL